MNTSSTVSNIRQFIERAGAQGFRLTYIATTPQLEDVTSFYRSIELTFRNPKLKSMIRKKLKNYTFTHPDEFRKALNYAKLQLKFNGG